MKSVMHEASSIAKAIEQAWVKAGQPQEFSVKILEEPQKNFLGFTTRSAKVALFFDHGGSSHGTSKSNFGGTPREQSRDMQRESYRDTHKDQSHREPREPRESREFRETSNKQKKAQTQIQASHEQSAPRRAPAAPSVAQQPVTQKNNTGKRQEKPALSPTAAPLETSTGIIASENETPVLPQNHAKKEVKLLWSDATTRYTQEWLHSTLESMDCTHINIAISASTPVMHITMKCKAPEYLHMESNKERKILASISHLLMDALRQKFKTGFKQHKIIIAPESESAFTL